MMKPSSKSPLGKEKSEKKETSVSKTKEKDDEDDKDISGNLNLKIINKAKERKASRLNTRS